MTYRLTFYVTRGIVAIPDNDPDEYPEILKAEVNIPGVRVHVGDYEEREKNIYSYLVAYIFSADNDPAACDHARDLIERSPYDIDIFSVLDSNNKVVMTEEDDE